MKDGRFAIGIIMSALVALVFPLFGGAEGAQPSVFLHETFRDLNAWKPLYFPKIKEHSTYTAVAEEGRTWLKTESRASALAIVLKKTFNVYNYPALHWRWKVDNLYRNWDEKEKAGDDYPIRIYVLFEYDPDKAGFLEKLQYGALKAIYGSYPPHSSLNYVWTSGEKADDLFASPFTDRARMVALEKGAARLGQWVEERANIIDDYRRAFGEDPPATAGIAIMNDSDNTGEAAVSYVEFIEISAGSPAP